MDPTILSLHISISQKSKKKVTNRIGANIHKHTNSAVQKLAPPHNKKNKTKKFVHRFVIARAADLKFILQKPHWKAKTHIQLH